MPGQISKGIWIHVRRPTCQANVPKSVEVKGVELGKLHSLVVLFPETGLFNMPASCRRRKNPFFRT